MEVVELGRFRRAGERAPELTTRESRGCGLRGVKGAGPPAKTPRCVASGGPWSRSLLIRVCSCHVPCSVAAPCVALALNFISPCITMVVTRPTSLRAQPCFPLSLPPSFLSLGWVCFFNRSSSTTSTYRLYLSSFRLTQPSPPSYPPGQPPGPGGGGHPRRHPHDRGLLRLPHGGADAGGAWVSCVWVSCGPAGSMRR